MSERLKDKVALITGAAQGLGKEMARSMISEGAEVFISDINQDQLDETVTELSCSGISLDVTKSEDWQKAVSYIKDKSGSLNILVNNAGIGNGGDHGMVMTTLIVIVMVTVMVEASWKQLMVQHVL